jgi:redox-sensing transcriptional repressor
MAGSNSTVRVREAGNASLRRMPLYYRLLQQMVADGEHFVSSSHIGKNLGLDPTQVRKDIEITGVAGKPKVGFVIADLLRSIETFLGWDRPKEAVLAGAGSLGSALLRYERFREYGISIVAAFDTDPQKVGNPIGGKEVFLLDSLPGRAQRMGVHLGVITTPPRAAQRVADLMVEGGIRAIWNFAPVHLRVPGHVIVHYEDLCHSLASLSFRLAKRAGEEGGESIDESPDAAAYLDDLALQSNPEEVVEPDAAQAGSAGNNEE